MEIVILVLDYGLTRRFNWDTFFYKNDKYIKKN
jgi:hypothetical protein